MIFYAEISFYFGIMKKRSHMKVNTYFLRPLISKLLLLFLIFPLLTDAQPTARFSISPSSPICINTTVTLTDQSLGTGLSYNWDFGNSASPQTANTAGPHQVSFLSPLQDTARLIVTDNMGLKDTFEVIVNPIAVGPITISSPSSLCQGDLVTFLSGINSPFNPFYYWDFGPGAIPRYASTPNPGPIQFPNAGTNQGKLIINDRGCSDSATFTIVIHPGPQANIGNDTLLCHGQSLPLNGALSTGLPASFSWSCNKPAQCGYNTTSSGTPTVTPIAIQAPLDTVCYYYYGVDFNGCMSNADSLCIIIAEPPTAFGGPDTFICLGDAAQLQGSYTSHHGFSSVLWFPNLGLSNPNILNPFASPPQITTYGIEVTDTMGCSSQIGIQIVVPLPCGQDSVWPGDANYDGVANNLDVLTIGTVFGRGGYTRQNASLNWVGQRAFDWGDSLANGAEIKHVDCNGDGTINIADTAAISQNYGQTHNKRGRSGNGALLYAEVLQDSLMTGDTATLIIYLGTDTLPADSIYGIAFTLSFNQSLLQDSGAIASISYDTTWLGQSSIDLLNFSHYLADDGEIDFAMTRLDHQNRSGFGRIARADIVMVEDLSGKRALSELLSFSFSDIVALSADQHEIPISFADAEVVLTDPNATGIQQAFSGPRPVIYPQPAQQAFVIAFEQAISFQAKLYELSGKQVWEGKGVGKEHFDISDLPAAYYVLEIVTDKGRIFEKFVVR